jgi:hypothetical protein
MPNAASGSQLQACRREGQVPESARKDLIAAIAAIVRREELSDEVRDAALTLIGWLARRHGDERACTCGLYEARKQAMAVHGGRR